eukprot:TRINITY_DN314_c0_g1_i1.p1 TRINITY_DN314_c0_g1~~TRINITY_DN314_c0_g1_i1.p1  ORF type:complete len:609 (+),score=103.34 TRINITY_DN314_c0_g1_i1:55-1881(+)
MNLFFLSLVIFTFFSKNAVFGMGMNCRPDPSLGAPIFINNSVTPQMSSSLMPVNFTVALIGDSGLGVVPQQVLSLIKAENAEIVIHSGDFDYQSNPTAWENQINSILGADYPYFASMGNHEVAAWPGYRQVLYDRLNRINAACNGEVGVNLVCAYKGLVFVLSGVGTMDGPNHSYGPPRGYETFFKNSFISYPTIWRICSYHKNQRLLQVGSKYDEVGYYAYDTCREAGAIIATGHEHSYSRTFTMASFSTQRIYSTSSPLVLDYGLSYAFVHGIAGASLRPFQASLETNPWWASAWSTTNDINYGALICKFNWKGNIHGAYCYLKTIDDRILDEFEVLSNMDENNRGYTYPNPAVIEVQVNSGDSDVMENLEGFVSCSNPTLELATNGSIVALRFTSVQIPRGARIRRSFLEFTSALALSTRTDIIITGEDSDDSDPFICDSLFTISGRPKTSETVLWSSVTPWDVRTTIRDVYRSPDINEIIEEISSRPGWRPGNAMTFFVTGVGRRFAYGYEAGKCDAPSLVVEFEPIPPPSVAPTLLPSAPPAQLPSAPPAQLPSAIPASSIIPTTSVAPTTNLPTALPTILSDGNTILASISLICLLLLLQFV